MPITILTELGFVYDGHNRRFYLDLSRFNIKGKKFYIVPERNIVDRDAGDVVEEIREQLLREGFDVEAIFKNDFFKSPCQ